MPSRRWRGRPRQVTPCWQGAGAGPQMPSAGQSPRPPSPNSQPGRPPPPVRVRFASAGLRHDVPSVQVRGSLLIVHVSRLTPLPLSDASPAPGRTASLPAALATLVAPQVPRPSLVSRDAQSCSSDGILAHSLPLSCLTWGSLCEPPGLGSAPTFPQLRPHGRTAESASCLPLAQGFSSQSVARVARRTNGLFGAAPRSGPSVLAGSGGT